MSNIYLSGFAPRGVRREWERTSIGCEDAAHVLDKYLSLRVRDTPTSALAYWSPDGCLRVMACDMEDQRRIVLRTPKSGNWSVEILPGQAA